MTSTYATTADRLFYGDNLDILRGHIADESADVIYLDPPFNSNATYNVLLRERFGDGPAGQITAFEDTWCWVYLSDIRTIDHGVRCTERG